MVVHVYNLSIWGEAEAGEENHCRFKISLGNLASSRQG